MEVFFNELSLSPLSPNIEDAKNKIYRLLSTLKELRNDDFNVMRTNEHFYRYELALDYSITHFFNDPSVSRDLKILLKDIAKNPYIVDSDSYEAEAFIMSEFKTTDEKGNAVVPEGLASAYVFNSPTISLTGNSFWEVDSIPLSITTHSGTENSFKADIPNLFSPSNALGHYFKNWLKSLVDDIELNSEANIAKVFSPAKFFFETRALTDLISWYHDDKRYLIRIKELINDIIDHPFVGGKGHTETLSGTGGKASKRIIKKDRIVYTYTKEKIIIHQCRGHYDDK